MVLRGFSTGFSVETISWSDENAGALRSFEIAVVTWSTAMSLPPICAGE
ncbi:hypothetical protein [Methylobacterium sp. CM6244]